MNTVDRIREWLFDNHYDGIIFHRRDNYAWINGGAESAVLSSGEMGVAYVVIKQTEMNIIADSSDLPRMNAELNPLGASPILVPWYQSMGEFLSDYIKDGTYVSDDGVAGTANVQQEMIDLRLCLTDDEVKHYEEIGQECAKIVESVCKEARIGDSEVEVANLVKIGCIKHGISPDCVLVGADSRILDYRHPMPTDKKIEKSLMVVLGGQKYGLNISMTRMVYFEEVPEEIKEKYKKTSHIFACMQHIMKEGLSYSEYFKQICDLYSACGYEEEWKMHHQGGPTGYGCREFVVTPNNDKQIHVGQAYAWNPTIQGTKCEETTYLGKTGVQTFTQTTEWPRTLVKTVYGDYEVADIYVKI